MNTSNPQVQKLLRKLNELTDLLARTSEDSAAYAEIKEQYVLTKRALINAY